jgi:hypothetical protein
MISNEDLEEIVEVSILSSQFDMDSDSESIANSDFQSDSSYLKYRSSLRNPKKLNKNLLPIKRVNLERNIKEENKVKDIPLPELCQQETS